MRTATLAIVQTSDECISYRLHDESGRIVWSNRVYPRPAGHAGARKRMAEWALKHGYRMVKGVPMEHEQRRNQTA